MMRVSMLLAILSLSISLGTALVVRLTLSDLIFNTSGVAIEETLRLLFLNHKVNLGLLLQLTLCDYFDLNKFMPGDPSTLMPLIKVLRRKKCPQKIEGKFYNSFELQFSEEGKKFLLDSNINFAQLKWSPFAFTSEQVKSILLKIQDSSPSQIEYLSIYALNGLGSDGPARLWGLFSIPAFPSYISNSGILQLWIRQINPYVSRDDLLFYRLVYLFWYYQVRDIGFANAASKLIDETVSEGFRSSVVDYYFPGKKGNSIQSLEIPDFVLEDDIISKASLHFEHLLATLLMGYQVSLGRVIETFQKFGPSLVSPFLCRNLLEHFTYRQFALILEASPNWKETYSSVDHRFSYLPKKLLPEKIQVKLWRNQTCHQKRFQRPNRPTLGLDDPQTWKKYLGNEYRELDGIAIEKDGFTFIDCCADEESIRTFVEGRIIELVVYDRPLPIFIPLLQKYDLKAKEKYSHAIKKDPLDNLCKQSEHHLTISRASALLDQIVDVLEAWDVPEVAFASF